MQCCTCINVTMFIYHVHESCSWYRQVPRYPSHTCHSWWFELAMGTTLLYHVYVEHFSGQTIQAQIYGKHLWTHPRCLIAIICATSLQWSYQLLQDFPIGNSIKHFIQEHFEYATCVTLLFIVQLYPVNLYFFFYYNYLLLWRWRWQVPLYCVLYSQIDSTT